MGRESRTFGLSPKKVIDLLRIGTDVKPMSCDPKRDKAELLRNRLNETLRVSFSSSKKLTQKQSKMKLMIDTLSGVPVGELLQNPETDINLLRQMKDYGRKLSEQARTESEHHTANVIYYAAIACALIFHDQRITSFSSKDLENSFTFLGKAEWIPLYLTDLFRKAVQYYQNKT